MNKKLFTSEEILEEIMLAHDGQASLGLINREYEEKWKDKSTLRGKTPLATLRGVAQKSPKFERIGIGVYALQGVKRPQAPTAKTVAEKQERRHVDIQGMLLEIGNHDTHCADTYTPDKNGVFNEMLLGSIATIDKTPNFTYPYIVKVVRYVDVLWFNDRNFPMHAFEVEHSTNFRNSLAKFCDLQDFHVKLSCVAESSRREKFEQELQRPAFRPIKDRCKFLSYEDIERDYNAALTRSVY